jgi:ABC-type multidrug transport system ATPase subunit
MATAAAAARDPRETTLPSTGTPVLEYRDVTLRRTWPYDTELNGVSFALAPGELALITLAPGHVRSPFADLTQALLHPHGGDVRFLDRSWRDRSGPDAARARFALARVFDVGGWISNLDVDENVLLAHRHYNTASADQLHERADALAREFGLPDGVPRRRPAAASQFELRLSQWARALLGDVRLLVLERPTKDVRPEAVPPFLKAVRAARDRGAAVLWITTDGASPTAPHNIAPADITARFAMRAARLERS